jgi:hypothetical protein
MTVTERVPESRERGTIAVGSRHQSTDADKVG